MATKFDLYALSKAMYTLVNNVNALTDVRHNYLNDMSIKNHHLIEQIRAIENQTKQAIIDLAEYNMNEVQNMDIDN